MMLAPLQHLALVNLCRKGRRSRLLLGLSGLAATLAAATYLILADVDPLWRWALLLPVFGSLLCILEAWTSTCVVLAALGAWDLGCGMQRIPDPGLESTLRWRAWKLVAVAFTVSLVLTGLVYACGCCG
jgi:membrane-bound ClpP family serine protease